MSKYNNKFTWNLLLSQCYNKYKLLFALIKYILTGGPGKPGGPIKPGGPMSP